LLAESRFGKTQSDANQTTMKLFWQRLSRRERGLVVLTLVILFLILGQYIVVAPFLERREWIKSQLDSQPQLLEKNLRYLAQKDALATALESTQSEIKAREPKLLVVDEINVRSLLRPIAFPQPQGVRQTAAQNLRVSITVAGYARTQPATIAKSGNPSDEVRSSGQRQTEE